MNYQNLAKIELHLHHEGAAPPDFIRQLAFEKKTDISKIFDANGGYIYQNFQQFLATYEAATQVLKTPLDYHRLTLAVLEQSAKHGVIYTEIFVSPDFCGGCDITAWQEHLAAIQEASSIACQRFNIETRIIVTCIRHYGPEQARLAARCAAETAGNFVTGFGMGGDENMGRQGDFSYAFDMAREAQLSLTTHAGEWGGAESVRQAIFDLKVERLGHGIQIIHSPDLINEVKARQITLEVCPGSNVKLGASESWEQHPIAQLYQEGVLVTVSTDDPPFFHTDMTAEYHNLNKVFGWNETQFVTINKNAINAAFCEPETKKSLLKKVEKSWENI